jgi:CRISPR/Cas system-associated protein Cas5 (RAMP superfamily)
MSFIKLSGYVTSVVDKHKVLVKIDLEDIEKVSSVITKFGKKETYVDFVTVNVKSASIEITDVKWNELEDLKGIHINITCRLRSFDFPKLVTTYDIDNNPIRSYTYIKGVSLIAQKIKNV